MHALAIVYVTVLYTIVNMLFDTHANHATSKHRIIKV